MKILIVEDQTKLAALLKQGLSEAGYAVGSATTCATARDALSTRLSDETAEPALAWKLISRLPFTAVSTVFLA